MLTFTLVILTGVFGMLIGYVVGHRFGVDSGWVERHFQEIARERARRNPDGTFKQLHHGRYSS